MARDIVVAVIVLAVSCSLAAVANVVRPDEKKRMDWLRQPLNIGTPTPAPKTPESEPANKADNAVADDQAAMQDAAPAANHDADPNVVRIDEVLAYLTDGGAYFIDARAEHEFEEGHLRGAYNLPSNAVYANIDPVVNMIPMVEPVIVYCGGGDCEASHVVANVLRNDFGYTNVRIYTNGWAEVESSGRFDDLIETGAR